MVCPDYLFPFTHMPAPISGFPCFNDAGILLHHCNIYSLVQLHVSVLHTIPREHESLDIYEQLLSFKESLEIRKQNVLAMFYLPVYSFTSITEH